METTTEKNWQVDTGESVFETDAETLKQWIWEGAVLPHHRVSRGGLRWLEVGKVPQFAREFETAQEMSDLLGPSVKTELPKSEDRYALPSEIAADAPPSYRLNLIVGSLIAFAVAISAGYLWAYQISASRDLDALNKSPQILLLQSTYDTERSRLQDVLKSVTPEKPISVPKPLTSGSSGINCSQTSGSFQGSTASVCNAGMQQAMEKWAKENNRYVPNLETQTESHPITDPVIGAKMTDANKNISDLDAKFEGDKKKAIEDLKSSDRRGKFLPAFMLLFFGLAGLNIARISLFRKK